MHTTTTHRLKHLALLFALAAGSQAHALPPSCDGPKPPPICNGPTPPAPMPAAPLRPGLGGRADHEETRLYVAIQAQPADRTKIARAVIQRGSSPDGPWQGWFDLAFSPSANPAPYYTGYLTYDSVLPTTCFRGRVADAHGQYSPWSTSKCSNPIPAATQLQAAVGINSVAVAWMDNSAADVGYRIEFIDPDGSHRQVMAGPDFNPTPGPRQQTVSRPWRPANVCIRVWSIEVAPGNDGNSSTVFSDSTAIGPTIQPGPRVCFPTPGL